MPNLRHFLLFASGLAMGFSAAKIFVQNDATHAVNANITTQTASVQKDAHLNINETPDGKELFPSLPSQSCPDVPVCPCLFSDKILPPPEFTHDMKAMLESNFEGEVLVKWTPVNGAKRYEVHLESKTGELLKAYKTPRTILYLKDIPLPPGKFEADYSLRLVSVNGKDQPGPKSSTRALHVKPQATVVAPQVQEIRVED